MNDNKPNFERLEAIAREHGCALAFLGTELIEDGEPLFSPMLLRIEERGNGLSLDFRDIDGDERMCFLLRSDDFERAREEGDDC